MNNLTADALLEWAVAPHVIETDVASERAHLAWPKIASDGGNNLVIG